MSADLTLLMSQLDDNDATVRAQAAEELSRLGEAARPASAALVAVCGDPSEDVREWAVAALEGLGSPETSDVGQLAGLIRHEHADVTYWAVTLLGRSGEAAKASVHELAAALRDHPEAAVRQRAAWALGKIGPVASGAVEVLRIAADSDDARLARLAGRAIGQIQG